MSRKSAYTHEVEDNHKRDFICSVISKIVLALAICGFISLFIVQGTKDFWYYTNTTDAIYKGSIQHGDRTYPIIEIDGTEYISKIHQPVRDITFVGKTIQIKYNETFDDFKIFWGVQFQ